MFISSPDQSNNALFSAYGALLVSVVAGGFSLLGLTVAKENKVSEFRQEWINALRDDIAEFVAQAQLIHSEIFDHATQGYADRREHLDRTRDPYLDLNRVGTRIKLRLNMAEEDNQQLMKALNDLHNLLRAAPTSPTDFQAQFGPISKTVEMQTAIVLAKEWKRVKRGEPGYRRAKAIAGTALLLSVGVAIALIIVLRHH